MPKINTDEQTFFTDSRNKLLKDQPELIELENLWSKYCFVPLDLPVYDYPEINKWFWEQSTPIRKIEEDIASRNTGDVNFDGINVYPNGDMTIPDVWTANPKQEFLGLFPELLERIMDEFPFKTIPSLKFWSSNKHIHFHRDHSEFTDYPTSFRIMLSDDNPNQTLKLIETLPNKDPDYSSMFTIPRIPETNSFVWNNLRTKHGSTYTPEYRKLLLIIGKVKLDIKKYNDLMERSVSKYKDFTLTSIRTSTDYLN